MEEHGAEIAAEVLASSMERSESEPGQVVDVDGHKMNVEVSRV